VTKVYANDTEGAAADYRERGLATIPVKRRSKEPKLPKGHPFLKRKATDAELASFDFRHNVAIVTGKISGIVVLDDDDDGETMRKNGWHAPATPTVRTKRGYQYYMRCPAEGFPTFDIAEKVEVRGDGAYVVAPPSIHPSGEQYEWAISPDEAEFADLPEWLLKQARIRGRRMHAEDIGEMISNGSRNKTLCSIAGTLRRRGLDEASIYAALLGINEAKCETPLDADEVRKIAHSVAGYEPEYDSNDSNDSVFQDLAALPDPEEFPLSALPLTVRQFAREAAASVGCPIDYLGLSTLAAASAAIGDTRRIVIKKDWTEGAAIFGMIVGGPASKKTPAMNLALRPLRERQMALKAEYERQKEEYESALRDWEKAKKDGPSELRKPDKPTLVRTYADDTTVERLADILNENQRGLLIIKDELSGWLGAMNQYKQGGRGADRQFWLSVHTNQPVAVDRKSTDEPVIVARPFVSIVGGIQPEVLPDFGKDRGDGLIDRFISVYPKPRVGRWSDDEISDHVREEYARTLGSLYRLRHANDDEDPFPSRVPMTDEAKGLFVAEYNRLHEELESPGFPQRLRPAWGKLEAYMARVALILAMTRIAELGNQGQVRVAENVTREDMTGAVKLLAYFKNHVRRVYTGLYGDSPSDRLAADLREFLIFEGGTWEGIASELHDALISEHKPERPEDLAKAVRAIAKRSPLLQLEDLKRTQDRRPFRLTLRNAVIADIAVMPEAEEEPKVVSIESGEPYDVYVGRGKRGTKLKKSRWHNPFKIDEPGKPMDGTREECVEKFERYLYGPVENYEGKVFDGRHLMADLPEIVGKILGCHCAPRSCHADVLLRLANANDDPGVDF
jgi:hypothetical protein